MLEFSIYISTSLISKERSLLTFQRQRLWSQENGAEPLEVDGVERCPAHEKEQWRSGVTKPEFQHKGDCITC